MTRSHKYGDRIYSEPVESYNGDLQPRFFAKAGFEGTDPKKVKKEGGGKGNWGRPGTSELEDVHHNPAKPRRRSNSLSFSSHNPATREAFFKTKFEEIEHEPVFEDHMAEMMEQDRLSGHVGRHHDHDDDDEDKVMGRDGDGDQQHEEGGYRLDHQSTTSSVDSVDRDGM